MYLSSIGSSASICTPQTDQKKATTVKPPLSAYCQQLNSTRMKELLVTFSMVEAVDGV